MWDLWLLFVVVFSCPNYKPGAPTPSEVVAESPADWALSAPGTFGICRVIRAVHHFDIHGRKEWWRLPICPLVRQIQNKTEAKETQKFFIYPTTFCCIFRPHRHDFVHTQLTHWSFPKAFLAEKLQKTRVWAVCKDRRWRQSHSETDSLFPILPAGSGRSRADGRLGGKKHKDVSAGIKK